MSDTGEFARILGLNNTDTILNPDPRYECLSQHYVKFEIKSAKHLSMVKGRFYRLNPRGMDYLLEDYTDPSLIGQTIYLHSPMTCASHSAGHGICSRCYGTLYWVNLNINIGKYAAENVSSKITQRMLSAKHLLETIIEAIKWSQDFKLFIDIDIDKLKISEDLIDDDNLRKYTLIIDPNDVQLVSDEEDAVDISGATVEDEESDESSESEDSEEDVVINTQEDRGVYNEYITSFIIRTPDGTDHVLTSEDQHELYISNELNAIIRKKAYASEGKVHIPLTALIDEVLFYIKINNNEISKIMNDIEAIINKAAITESLSKSQALQSLADLVIDGGLDIDLIHLEVILSNQIVNPDNLLKKPNWNNPNVKYKMITLNSALTNNPSVIISLLYKDLHRTLYNPLTYTKNAPSFFDLFFCEQPQNYMNDDLLTDDTSDIRDYEDGVQMYRLTNKPSREAEIMAKLEESMREDEERERNAKDNK